jgi:cytochrome c oxidase subunit 2
VDYRHAFDAVFEVQLAIAGGVFVLITGLLLVAIAANSARRRRKLPFTAAENNGLEIGVAVVLGLAAAGLVYLSLSTNHDLAYGDTRATAADLGASPAAGPAPVDIDVTAFQWCWQADYPGAPGAPPRRTVTGSCATPQDRPVIVVPQGRPVQFSITSRDVVHAFWIPELAVKRDAMPDHVNTLTMTFPDLGQWLGRCSEYCGLHHVDMDFYVRAVPPDQYDTFLQTGSVTA